MGVTYRRIAFCYGCRFCPGVEVYQKHKENGKHGSNNDRTFGLQPVVLDDALFLQWNWFVRSGLFDIQRSVFGLILRLVGAFLLRENGVLQRRGFCFVLGFKELFETVGVVLSPPLVPG